jgi:cysteinyl-tRNA synthetase
MMDDVSDDHEGDERVMFRAALQLLGLLQMTDSEWRALRPAGVEIDETLVDKLIEDRRTARAAKNFAEADRIRGELDAIGVLVKDGPEGTTWEVKR